MSTRRAAARRAMRAPRRSTLDKARVILFPSLVVGVLAIGAILAFGDFFNRPGAAPGAIEVQSSMAGFTPSTITVKAGETVTLDWWTQDAAVHLEGGVHTMIAPDLGLREELPAEGRRLVEWTVPSKPGTYDVWCDTCCGGKESPNMHGKIVVLAAA